MLSFHDNDNIFTFQLTKKRFDFLSEAKIYCDQLSTAKTSRWKIGDIIVASTKISVEPYIGFYTGNSIADFGAFSYTSSAFSPNFSVGRYCSIAENVQIFGADHPYKAVTSSAMAYLNGMRLVNFAHKELGLNKVKLIDFEVKLLPNVGNDVWIGQNVLLARNIHIGDGAVIAAGSVVTKDVEPYSIVGGNPAKFITYRFDKEVCEGLSMLKWWEYNFKDIAHLDISKPKVFLDEFFKLKCNIEPWKPKKINLYDNIRQIV